MIVLPERFEALVLHEFVRKAYGQPCRLERDDGQRCQELRVKPEYRRDGRIPRWVCVRCGNYSLNAKAKLATKRASPEVLVSTIWAILVEQEYRCALCPKSLWRGPQEDYRLDFDLDHILPIWSGGSNDKDNLRCLCRPCHLARPRHRPPRPSSRKKKASSVDPALSAYFRELAYKRRDRLSPQRRTAIARLGGMAFAKLMKKARKACRKRD